MTNQPSKKKGSWTKYIVAGLLSVLIITQWEAFIELLNTEVGEIENVSPAKETTNSVQPEKNQNTPPTQLPPKTSKKEERTDRVKFVTWNLYNIGLSKDDEEMEYIASLLRNYDIVAVQEVSTQISGPRAITKLNEELSRKGSKWDYVISDPTSGAGAERYAYLWRTEKVKLLGRPWLVKAKDLDERINREPYMARFKVGDNRILMGNFHAVPSSKNPAKEIELLDELHTSYSRDNLAIMGDFNLSQKAKAFDGLKSRGYRPVLLNQKTSLKTKRKNGEHLAQEYDNVFYENSALQNLKSGVIDFSKDFETLKEARNISDHLPVWCELKWRPAETETAKGK